MKKKTTPGISDAEWKVMEVLWTRSPATANEVIDSLQNSCKWSGNTIRTLLSRLVRKGALKARKDGPRFLYSPALERERHVAAESDSFLKRVFFGSPKPLLLHFAERTRLSADEIEELKRFLDKNGGSK
jgi:BlaI family penicillinase repressor